MADRVDSSIVIYKGVQHGLDTVEILLWAEKEFSIEIPDSIASKIRTLGKFTEHIGTTSRTKYGAEAPNNEEVFSNLKDLLISQYRTPTEQIIPDAEFIKDLGLQ